MTLPSTSDAASVEKLKFVHASSWQEQSEQVVLEEVLVMQIVAVGAAVAFEQRIVAVAAELSVLLPTKQTKTATDFAAEEELAAAAVLPKVAKVAKHLHLEEVEVAQE